ncbi:hypothetical protein J437_LFUL007436 [Ladona fulva]|uniref:Uncharacterized protein n=1 Tax=Ladona fulva TaxID=123851 RepID=A0A8K0K3V4_LADFU|nr:hypothetical protein J437_LFUL007436 [Ladona fulva]
MGLLIEVILLSFASQRIEILTCSIEAHSHSHNVDLLGLSGVFLVPYFLILVVCGIPLLYMELAVGQYTRRGPIGAIGKMCPLFKGAGMASVVISFLMSTYYNVIIAWALYYFFTAFKSHLPWRECLNRWNTVNCLQVNSSRLPTAVPLSSTNPVKRVASGKCCRGFAAAVDNIVLLQPPDKNLYSGSKVHESRSPTQEFYDHKVLQVTSGIEDPGAMRWELVACLFVAWILVYFSLWKSVKSSGKVVYFTATFPYILIVAFLARAVTLEGAELGLAYFFNPKWELLGNANVSFEYNDNIICI